MSTTLQPLVIVNAVGLTPALARRMSGMSGFALAPMQGVFPALTLTAQASMLTGAPPSEHGVVGNGWYRREVGEVRFWVQAHRQLERPTLISELRRRARAAGTNATVLNAFWWFAQGMDADWVMTPKPHYGADGSKAFDILTSPPELAASLKARHGDFPFHTFWGPKAGLPASLWIANAAASAIREHKPTLSLVYLPHLDYEPQRRGASGSNYDLLLPELWQCLSAVKAAADAIGARLMIVSEYGIEDASSPVEINRLLRRTGFLSVRDGPFGEMLDVMDSRAFAVCDHQCAHVYVKDPDDAAALGELRGLLSNTTGIEQVLVGDERASLGINHPRAGELVCVATSGSWYAYPYWLDDERAPDFARTVDIHRKPGYDPCELFFDPQRTMPEMRAIAKVLAKKAGLRALVDVIPLDPSLVRGSHGRLADPGSEHGPLIASHDASLVGEGMSMLDLKDHALRAMGL